VECIAEGVHGEVIVGGNQHGERGGKLRHGDPPAARTAHAGTKEEQAAAHRGEVPADRMEGVGKNPAEDGEQKHKVGEHEDLERD
jgi:hypothetical protein